MRYFIGFFITIGLIILLIIMLITGGDKPKVPAGKTLDSYAATSAEVSMTIDGPVNSALEHQQIRIGIDRDNVTYEELKGYDGNVTEMHSFPNTENAYNVFLSALAHAGFTKGNTSKDLANEKGYCPLGNRFIFELTHDGKQIERFWATSCGNPKTFLGNTNITIQLFKNQVPDYSELSQNVNL